MDEIDKVEQARTQFVKVTNGLPFAIQDRFDGIPYYIRPGQHENLPIPAAMHMLGYTEPMDPERMQRHVCRRMGWNTMEFLEVNPKTKKTKAQEYFELLKIEPVVYKLVRVDAETIDPNAPVPADPEIPDAMVERRGPGRPRKFDIGVSA